MVMRALPHLWAHRMRENPEAIELLDRALALDANYGLAAGRYGEAIRYAQMVLDERPGMTWPYGDLATYRAHRGDLPGTRDALEKFIYLRPPMTLASVADGLKFMENPLLRDYIVGLRIAGLE